MNLFNTALSLATEPAFDQMAETIKIDSVEYQAIYDPLDRDESRMLGGRDSQLATNVFIKKTDVIPKNGSKLEFTQNDKSFKGRILKIIDDDTDLLTLQVAGLLTGAMPKNV